MANITNNDDGLREQLKNAQVIALVGHSDKPDRDSYRVGMFLREQGYTVYPVNPTVSAINGERSYATLAEIPEPIDIVDVFRGVRHLPRITEEAIQAGAKVVWGQLAITHADAIAAAEAAGMDYVMDRCIKIEYQRLGIER